MFTKKIPIFLGIDENKQNSRKVKKSVKRLEFAKENIKALTLQTQELILKSCAESDLELIRDKQGVRDFKNKLYKFQKYLIITEGYNFYNEFYIQMMEALDKKRELIEQYGAIEIFKEIPENLSLLETRHSKLNLFRVAKQKITEIFKLNKEDIKQNEKD